MSKQGPVAEQMMKAINQESYEFLQSKYPDMLDAVEAAVLAGWTAAEVGRFARRWVGEEREAMALRWEQAATYVAGLQVE